MLRVSMKKSFRFGSDCGTKSVVRTNIETSKGPSWMSALGPSLAQHLDERGCEGAFFFSCGDRSLTSAGLSRDVRDAVTSVSSRKRLLCLVAWFSSSHPASAVGHQEVFWLWEAFTLLADGNATLCATDFARLGRRVGVESVMHEWLFEAFDLNDDRILSFKDWVLCVEHTTRSTCRDLAAVAVRVLGETEAHARTRIPVILARQKVALSEAELENETRTWMKASTSEEIDFRVMSLKVVQVSCRDTSFFACVLICVSLALARRVVSWCLISLRRLRQKWRPS